MTIKKIIFAASLIISGSSFSMNATEEAVIFAMGTTKVALECGDLRTPKITSDYDTVIKIASKEANMSIRQVKTLLSDEGVRSLVLDKAESIRTSIKEGRISCDDAIMYMVGMLMD